MIFVRIYSTSIEEEEVIAVIVVEEFVSIILVGLFPSPD